MTSGSAGCVRRHSADRIATRGTYYYMLSMAVDGPAGWRLQPCLLSVLDEEGCQDACKRVNSSSADGRRCGFCCRQSSMRSDTACAHRHSTRCRQAKFACACFVSPQWCTSTQECLSD